MVQRVDRLGQAIVAIVDVLCLVFVRVDGRRHVPRQIVPLLRQRSVGVAHPDFFAVAVEDVPIHVAQRVDAADEAVLQRRLAIDAGPLRFVAGIAKSPTLAIGRRVGVDTVVCQDEE